MAVTKIKPIRGTVNKALAYILDPQKTDDAFYVSSYVFLSIIVDTISQKIYKPANIYYSTYSLR